MVLLPQGESDLTISESRWLAPPSQFGSWLRTGPVDSEGMPRTRTQIRLGLGVIGVLLTVFAAAFVQSLWIAVTYRSPSFGFAMLADGRVMYARSSTLKEHGFEIEPEEAGFDVFFRGKMRDVQWWIDTEGEDAIGSPVVVPLWIPVAVLAMGAGCLAAVGRHLRPVPCSTPEPRGVSAP